MIEAAQLIDLLALAHALLDYGWCQEALARTQDGRLTDSSDPAAVRWCAIGALHFAASEIRSGYCGSLYVEAMHFVAAAAGTTNGGLVCFNNAPGRTAAEVKALFEEAAAKIGKG